MYNPKILIGYLSNYYGSCTFEVLLFWNLLHLQIILLMETDCFNASFFFAPCSLLKSSYISSVVAPEKKTKTLRSLIDLIGVLIIFTEIPSLGFVSNRDIPGCGRTWRRQAPSTWSWLIMCSPSVASSKA